MTQKFSISIILMCFLIISGCEFFVAGAMTGAGVFSYMDGNLQRSYQAQFNDTVQACTEALETHDLKIIDKKVQGLTATIKSEYYNGKPVVINILRADINITEVSVRSGLVGVWDKDFSEKIHVSISQQLQK